MQRLGLILSRPLDILRDAITFTESSRRKTVTSADVEYALWVNGHKTVYGGLTKAAKSKGGKSKKSSKKASSARKSSSPRPSGSRSSKSRTSGGGSKGRSSPKGRRGRKAGVRTAV